MPNWNELLRPINSVDLQGKLQLVYSAVPQRPVPVHEIEAIVGAAIGDKPQVENILCSITSEIFLVSIIIAGKQLEVDQLRQPLKSGLGQLGTKLTSTVRDF